MKQRIKLSRLKYIIRLLLGITMILSIVGCGDRTDTGQDESEFQAYYEPLTSEDIAAEGNIYYASSQILLTAVDDAAYKDIKKLIDDKDGEIIGYISVTGDYQIRFPNINTFEELEQLVRNFKDEALIEDASLAYIARFENDAVNYTDDPWIDVYDPSDSSGSIWDEENPDGKNWWAEAINMPSVWDMDLNTQSVKVGIIDSMFDIANEDLDEELFADTWNNPVNEDGTCSVTQLFNDAVASYEQAVSNEDQGAMGIALDNIDNFSHGTHVAGIIAAQAGNGFGIAGINQNARLYGYAVLSAESFESDESQWSSIFQFKCAIAHLLNEGVKVINISMGFNKALKGTQDGDPSWENFTSVNSRSMESFLLKYIENGNEFLIVKSAGNDSSSKKKYDAANDFLGAITNRKVSERIIIVGAVKYNSYYGYYPIADFSNTGSRVDVYAPGVNILSDIPSNATALSDGTSMSAPVVTGLASLIWGINPDLSSEQVRSIIITSTSATMFNLDDESFIVRDLINLAADPAPIVNAGVCVQLAQAAVGNGNTSNEECGILTGIIYAVTSDGTDIVDIDIETISLYDENNELVSILPLQDIADPVTAENTGEVSNLILHSYSAIVKPGTYTLKVEATGYEPQTKKVEINPNDVVKVHFEFINNSDDEEVFEMIPSEFTFSSGAGGWATVLNIESDGTFHGQYHDSDMGDSGPGYSNGTVYICNFSGKFTEPEKISEYIYSMNIQSLNVEGTAGTEYYENDIRYIVSDPYGFDNADEFYIYLPGAPIEELSEGFLSWAYLNSDVRDTLPSGLYGIYNINGEEGFVGMDDNIIWDRNYIYYYEGRKSALWPSYSNVSHLLFWPESGASVIDLQFTWSHDDQTEFDAFDSMGGGDYHISLDISADLSTIVVTATSTNGIDMSAWGGTADGQFTAEYTNEYE